MFLNHTQIAATVTGLVFVIGTGSLSQMASAQTPTHPGSPTGITKPHQERHPELRAALRNLKQARAHLQRGAHDFGGERFDALVDTDKAIREVEEALKADRH